MRPTASRERARERGRERAQQSLPTKRVAIFKFGFFFNLFKKCMGNLTLIRNNCSKLFLDYIDERLCIMSSILKCDSHWNLKGPLLGP